MTPGAGTAQAVRRIPRGTGWLTAVVSDDTGRQTGNTGRLTEILKSLTELTGRLTGKTISQPRQTGSRFRPPDS